jgi:microcin C transport system substrate-binding protein
MLRKIIFIVLLLVFFTSGVLLAKDITTSHGITLYGDLMYGKDFKHFNYVNPKAPKGGTIVWDMGNFDNINSYIALGTSPGFATFSVFENLMVTNADEPNSAYGLIAETVTYPEDYKWAEFKIRDIARWNDGKPITVEDVIYSYETMRDKASPTYKSLVADIEKVEKTGKDTVKFIFLKPVIVIMYIR